MNILCVIPYYVPAYSYGWPIKVAHGFNTALTKKWYNITVITTDAHDASSRNPISEEMMDGIRIIRHKNLSNTWAKFSNAYFPRSMKKRLKKNITDFDLVHIHDILNAPAIRASHIAHDHHIPYILHPHGILSPVRVWARFGFLKKALLSLFSSMLDNASGIFALTQQENQDVQQHTDNPHIHILPNGIDLHEFDDITPRDLRTQYNLSPDTIIFSFLGRIQYIKWLDQAFHLLADFHKENQNRRYLIIGPDEGEQKKLEKLAHQLWIHQNIIRYGISTGKERYELLAGSDIFLFLSRAEWFPMTLLEALWCQLPLAISSWCNLPEAERWWVWKICDMHDTVKLREIIAERQNYKKNTNAFLQKFNHERITTQLITAYANIE